MTIVKIIDVISEGKSVDEAIKNAVKEAAKTVKMIQQVNVEHIYGIVDNDEVTKYRVHCKLSFIVEN